MVYCVSCCCRWEFFALLSKLLLKFLDFFVTVIAVHAKSLIMWVVALAKEYGSLDHPFLLALWRRVRSSIAMVLRWVLFFLLLISLSTVWGHHRGVCRSLLWHFIEKTLVAWVPFFALNNILWQYGLQCKHRSFHSQPNTDTGSGTTIYSDAYRIVWLDLHPGSPAYPDPKVNYLCQCLFESLINYLCQHLLDTLECRTLCAWWTTAGWRLSLASNSRIHGES